MVSQRLKFEKLSFDLGLARDFDARPVRLSLAGGWDTFRPDARRIARPLYSVIAEILDG
jgi:hypothetical protein